jgi:ribosomal subunit interface protein
MNIIIQSPGFKASDNLQSLVREKLEKFDHQAHKIVRADVTLTQEAGIEHPFVCEVRLEMPGNDPFVKKSGDSFEKAVAEAVDALQSVLHKMRDKAKEMR